MLPASNERRTNKLSTSDHQSKSLFTSGKLYELSVAIQKATSKKDEAPKAKHLESTFSIKMVSFI